MDKPTNLELATDASLNFWRDYLSIHTSEQYRENFLSALKLKIVEASTSETNKCVIIGGEGFFSGPFHISVLTGTTEETSGKSPFPMPTDWTFYIDPIKGNVIEGNTFLLKDSDIIPQETIEVKFNKLVNIYREIIQLSDSADGAGIRNIDNAYQNLIDFGEFHPEYKDQIVSLRVKRAHVVRRDDSFIGQVIKCIIQ